MKIRLSPLLLLLILVLLSGCLRRHTDFSLPVYDGHITGKVEYPLASLSPTGDTWVLLSADPYHNKLLQRKKTVDGSYDFTVSPGKYYVSAFRDGDGDGEWAFGKEAVGGRLGTDWDYDRDFQPLVRNDATVNVTPVLLHPFSLFSPAHQAVDLGEAPRFQWSPPAGVTLSRIRVLDSEGKTLWTLDTPRSDVIYGRRPVESGEVTLARALPLFAFTDYTWHVVGLREGSSHREVIAYSPIRSFRLAVAVDPGL